MKQLCKVLMVSCLALSLNAAAQQPTASINWQKCIGGSKNEKATNILPTPDGGFLITGSTQSNDGDLSGHNGPDTTTDAWVVKVSSSGSIQWQQSLGGSSNDVFESAMIASDGSYICVGTTASNDGDVSGNHGKTDVWLVKFTRSGNVVWKKCYGGSGEEESGNIRHINGKNYFIGTARSLDGDVIGLHPPQSGIRYNDDIWIFEFDNAGTFISGKCYGGSGREKGHDIGFRGNGVLLLYVEYGSSGGDFGSAGSADVFVMVVNSNFQYIDRIAWYAQAAQAFIKWNDSTFFVGNVIGSSCQGPRPTLEFSRPTYTATVPIVYPYVRNIYSTIFYCVLPADSVYYTLGGSTPTPSAIATTNGQDLLVAMSSHNLPPYKKSKWMER